MAEPRAVVMDDFASLIAALDQTYTEADLDRIAAALCMIPCDPSFTLILEVFATLHASCERGWRGDPLVHPPWVTRSTGSPRAEHG